MYIHNDKKYVLIFQRKMQKIKHKMARETYYVNTSVL